MVTVEFQISIESRASESAKMCRSNGNNCVLGKFKLWLWNVCVLRQRKCIKWWKWVIKNKKKKKTERALLLASIYWLVSQLGFDWFGLDFHTMWERRKSCSSVVVFSCVAWCYIAHRSQLKSINKIDIDLKAIALYVREASNCG